MKKNFKKAIALALTGMMVFSISLMTTSYAAAPVQEKKVKNLIIMIPDGMNVSATTLARWYSGNKKLNMDEMASGLVRTYSSDAAIADSAPAGSAYSTGYKSHTGYVASLPDVADMPYVSPVKAGDEKRPVATILEAAKLSGKATGIVATSEIMHATPADFVSHYPNRSEYDILSEQEVYQNIDVVLGGGQLAFVPGADKKNRKDGEDLISVLKTKGYDYVTDRGQLLSSKSNKIWGLFAPMAMKYDIDRRETNEPSLSEMTSKALSVLQKDKDGFFLMVEGSKIDWAAHANEPVGVVSDVLAFDNAVKIALDFTKKNNDTALIVVSDHGTGGLTIGNADTSKTYDKDLLSTFLNPIKAAKLTGEGLESKINAEKTNIKEVMETYYGISDLTEAEIESIKKAPAGSLNYAVGPIISKKAKLGWTTGGHTGEEVVLYTYLPGNKRITGVLDNDELGKKMASIFGMKLDEVTKKLFISAKKAFELKKATYTLDDTDKTNLVVVITKGNNILKMPVNKNIAILNGKTIKLKGVVVYNSIEAYVPEDAIALIK